MSKNSRQNRSLPFSVSQNFLTSSKTIQRLLRRTSIGKDDFVIEIGCGRGHITKELVKVCCMVDGFEIDLKLYNQLLSKLGNAENLKLRHIDFLKAVLPEHKPYKVFSNIPFSITSDIIRKLTTTKNPPQEAWLVMEKGAAKRFTGCPNDTPASILIKPFFDMKIDYYFERQDFHPMPSVDIVLIHFIRKIQSDIPMAQQKDFAHFVEKSLRYGIQSQLTKKQVSTALKLAKLPCIEKSGLMSYVQWLCLFRCYIRL
ncbi:MAG: rRNA adenine N(6)-methyltransferase family protein [Oscillospiraceae bacterium]|nr:rRNA adenine N(6)-methyltransferase family protein [Oscillospiraceae bacterium]